MQAKKHPAPEFDIFSCSGQAACVRPAGYIAKTVLPIPKLVRGLKKTLQGLFSRLSRDLPLEGQIFPATPIKPTLPTHPLVRGYIEKWRSQENIFSMA